jgi:hypothetical protein
VLELVPSSVFSAEPSPFLVEEPSWVEDPSLDSKVSPEISTVMQSFSLDDMLGDAMLWFFCQRWLQCWEKLRTVCVRDLECCESLAGHGNFGSSGLRRISSEVVGFVKMLARAPHRLPACSFLSYRQERTGRTLLRILIRGQLGPTSGFRALLCPDVP